ncbi:MAG: hypothetical protein K8R99_00500 [Actinomycetia bacterium]|nr:hypothetical protein [Actinomycetes bacterium]
MTATASTPAPKTAKAVKSTAKAVDKPVAKAAAKPTTRRPSSARAAGKRGAKPQATLPDNHTPSEAVAFDIRMDRNDLAPSVTRILSAGLNEPGTFHAITLFQNSLTSPGDPNRDPSVAIEAGRLVDSRS